MESIVKGKNRAYARYEESLLRRDALRREAEQYHWEYIQTFGELIEESFRLKIDCISKKKMIAYCQQKANRGERINGNALADYITKQMASYQQELDDLVKGVKAAREAAEVSAEDVKKIKTIYHRLAKKIHPDLHPAYAYDDTMMEYWHRIVVAYRHNQLKEMQELEALVEAYLVQRDGGTPGYEIRDVEEKIQGVEKEIAEILSTNPYLYKLILDDARERADHAQKLQDEIASYKRYAAQLDEVLGTFEIERWLS